MPQDLTTLLSQFLNALWAGTIGFPSGATGITEAAPGVIQIGGTPPTTNQGIRIPNGSNLEYATLQWTANVAEVGHVTNGGTQRNTRILAGLNGAITLQAGGGDSWIFGGAAATKVANLTTVGRGVPAIVASARLNNQSTNTGVAAFTVGAADGSFEVSANLLVTAVTTLATTITCQYTDESNTARVMTLPVSPLTGTFAAAGAITGIGPWSTPTMQIRCKAATSISLGSTAGTFTGVTYNIEGLIQQLV